MGQKRHSPQLSVKPLKKKNYPAYHRYFVWHKTIIVTYPIKFELKVLVNGLKNDYSAVHSSRYRTFVEVTCFAKQSTFSYLNSTDS